MDRLTYIPVRLVAANGGLVGLQVLTHPHMSNHFIYSGFTKVVYVMLYYDQYSLLNEIRPPHKRDTLLDDDIKI